jgi:hypothetical protein
MGSHQSGISLFRKFGDLNMLNLLSLQAELMHLRQELDWACKSDDQINETFGASRKYAFSFQAMKDAMPKEVEYEDEDEEATNNVGHCCECRSKARKVRQLAEITLSNGEVVLNARIDQWEIILKIREKLKEYSASNPFFFSTISIFELRIPFR